MTCSHQKYKAHPYMPVKEAWKAMKIKNDICYVGMVEKICSECEADISHERLVKVLTVKEYMANQ